MICYLGQHSHSHLISQLMLSLKASGSVPLTAACGSHLSYPTHTILELQLPLPLSASEQRLQAALHLPSRRSLTMSAQDNVIRIGTHLWTEYQKTTPKKLQVTQQHPTATTVEYLLAIARR